MRVWYALITWLILLLIIVAICGFCFDYTLYSCVDRNIPWYADCVVGTITSGFVVPACAICWAIRLSGVEPPFFDLGE